jgi:hypothetical protein
MIISDILTIKKVTDKINLECDSCHNIFTREKRRLIRTRIARNGLDLCRACSNLKKYRNNEDLNRVIVTCDICGNNFTRTPYHIKKNKQRHNDKIICITCANIEASKHRPQCQKAYWDNPEIKKLHGNRVKNSEKYKQSRKLLDIKGEKNGMFGKTHSIEAIQKMIKKRTGKKQSQKTIEKRQLTCKIKRENKLKSLDYFNINIALKGYIHYEIHWYKRIYERDKWKCVKCGSNDKIDAHHIKSFNSIIKELTNGMYFEKIIDKYNYLITCPEILDEKLENGITLCRSCHKKEHGHKWGSHNI